MTLCAFLRFHADKIFPFVRFCVFMSTKFSICAFLRFYVDKIYPFVRFAFSHYQNFFFVRFCVFMLTKFSNLCVFAFLSRQNFCVFAFSCRQNISFSCYFSSKNRTKTWIKRKTRWNGNRDNFRQLKKCNISKFKKLDFLVLWQKLTDVQLNAKTFKGRYYKIFYSRNQLRTAVS
jgi:hypothetical protein